MMTIRKALLYFIVCWGIFYLTATGISLLHYSYGLHLKIFSGYIFPVIAYGIIRLFIINKIPVELHLHHPIKIPLLSLLSIIVIALGLQIFNQSFVDIYYSLFYPESLDYFYSIQPQLTTDFWISFWPSFLISPFLEEWLFRGFFFKNLLSKYDFATAAIVSSLFFSVVHLPYYGKLLPSLVLGVLLCYIFYKTQNIGLAFALHALNNALAIFSDFVILNYWRPIVEQHFNWTYWSVISVGLIMVLMGLELFRKSIKEKPRENL